MTAGQAFADDQLSLSPAGLHTCTPAHLHTCTPAHLQPATCNRQPDVRLYRFDKADGESGGSSSHAIRLMHTPAMAKSPPELPDGWIQNQ